MTSNTKTLAIKINFTFIKIVYFITALKTKAIVKLFLFYFLPRLVGGNHLGSGCILFKGLKIKKGAGSNNSSNNEEDDRSNQKNYKLVSKSSSV